LNAISPNQSAGPPTGMSITRIKLFEKFRGTGYLFSVWFLDEKMEVFGRQRIGDDAEPEKGLKLAHESDGETAFLIAEEEAPVDDA